MSVPIESKFNYAQPDVKKEGLGLNSAWILFLFGRIEIEADRNSPGPLKRVVKKRWDQEGTIDIDNTVFNTHSDSKKLARTFGFWLVKVTSSYCKHIVIPIL